MVTASDLKRWKDRNGLTVAQIAERIGYPRTTVSSAFNNESKLPTLNLVAAICSNYETSITFLIYDEKELHALSREQYELLCDYMSLNNEQRAYVKEGIRLFKHKNRKKK